MERSLLRLQHQYGNRYVGGMLRQIGGSLEAEADRVSHAVAGGESTGSIEARAPAGVLQKFDSFEHKEIGDDATKGSHGEIKTVELAPDYRVTYGEMVALGGDYFGSISEGARSLRSPARAPERARR
jgi:hypothetical protein